MGRQGHLEFEGLYLMCSVIHSAILLNPNKMSHKGLWMWVRCSLFHRSFFSRCDVVNFHHS